MCGSTFFNKKYSIRCFVAFAYLSITFLQAIASSQNFEIVPTPLPSIVDNQGGGGGGMPTFPPPQFNPNPGFPWIPGNGIGSTPGSGLLINYSCPLLDQEGAGDLLVSIDSLERALPGLSDKCSKTTNFDELNKRQIKMKSNATEILGFFDNSKDTWVEGKTDAEYLDQVNGFGRKINDLMMDIKYISESIGGNQIFNPTCVGEVGSNTKALHALSDMIMQLSPYAMFAVNAGVGIDVMGPLVTGVSGLSGLVNAISGMHKNNLIDVSLSENRLLILKATCEYMRIESKLRLLRLEKISKKNMSGSTDELQKIIDSKREKMNQLTENLLKNDNNSHEMLSVIKDRQSFYSKITEIRTLLTSSRSEYKVYDKYYKGTDLNKTGIQTLSDSNFCILGKTMLENKEEGSYPYNLLKINRLLNGFSEFKNDINYRVAKVRLEEGLYQIESLSSPSFQSHADDMTSFFETDPYGGSSYCQSILKVMLDSSASYFDAVEKKLYEIEINFEKERRKNPKYNSWYEENIKLINEKNHLIKIAKFVNSASKSINESGLSEISQRLENLRHYLFGTQDNLPLNNFSFNFLGFDFSFKNQSPIGSWFMHTASKYDEFLGYFSRSLSKFLAETENELDRRISSNLIERIKSKGIVQIIGKSRKIDVLDKVNRDLFPKESSYHKIICNKLQQLSLDWEKAKEHIDSMRNFCSTIKEYIDYRTGAGVVEFCGLDTVDGKKEVRTILNDIDNKVDKKDLYLSANKVINKFNELQCLTALE